MKQITYIVIACTIVLLGSCELDYSEGTVYSKEEMFAMRAKGIDRMVWGIYGQLARQTGRCGTHCPNRPCQSGNHPDVPAVP